MIIDALKTETKFVAIYTLSNPLNNEIRYVGKTNNLNVRYDNHLSDVNKNKRTHKVNWIKSLHRQNVNPRMELLDIVKEDEWQFWEKYWIQQLKVWGFNLVNHSDGGEGLTFGNQTSFKEGHKVWNKGKIGIKLKPNKAVYQYSALTGEFIKEWSTAKKASKFLNINEGGIGQCARLVAKSAGGYIWRYNKENSVIPINYIGKTNNRIKNKLK